MLLHREFMEQALTLGQLLTSNSQVPIDPILMILDDDDNLLIPVHIRDG
jgi:hypothetical protein